MLHSVVTSFPSLQKSSRSISPDTCWLGRFRQVVRQLGSTSTSRLTRHFPEECAVVAQRHAEYRKRQKEERLRKIREEIRQVVFALHAQGEYPLMYTLSPFFPNGLMRQHEAIEAWREALQELGLEPENLAN